MRLVLIWDGDRAWNVEHFIPEGWETPADRVAWLAAADWWADRGDSWKSRMCRFAADLVK